MDTLLSIQRELDQVQRLLACFIFEVQVHLIENDPPTEILDTLATLVNHAPSEVLEQVSRLRRTPPEEQEDDYPYILPSFQDVSVEQLTPESLGLEASIIGKIREGMECSHEQNFKAFLCKALVKEAHIRIGMAQRYKEVDLTGLGTLELEKQHKSAELTRERIRRAVIALMLYNQQQPHPKLRARITQTAVHDLMGGRFDHIREFLEKHQEAIAEHHCNLEVPEKRSARVDLGAIRIPEESEAFGSLFL